MEEWRINPQSGGPSALTQSFPHGLRSSRILSRSSAADVMLSNFRRRGFLALLAGFARMALGQSRSGTDALKPTVIDTQKLPWSKQLNEKTHKDFFVKNLVRDKDTGMVDRSGVRRTRSRKCMSYCARLYRCSGRGSVQVLGYGFILPPGS